MLLKDLSSLQIKNNLSLVSPSNEPVPFKEIGIGKPLLIRLHSVYLGDLKDTGLFKSKKAVVVCSRIKDDITYNEAPRAVHQIFDKKDSRKILYPSAGNEGTPLIYYSQAFDKDLLRITLELKADNFNDKIFDKISSFLSSAAGLPIFSVVSNYILAGSQIIKSASDLINQAIDDAPAFLTFDSSIVDGVGGLRNTTEGFKMVINEQHENEFKGYEITESGHNKNQFKLSKNGKEYKGDAPYMIWSFNGEEVTHYTNFTPTLANANILKKFFGENENTGVEELNKMVELYSDFNYIEKIKKAEKLLIDSSGDTKERLEELIKAYKKNITNDTIFKI
ncbi:hypothetical protein [Formosa sp. S-31]|uniref:hypothetical protein n=1 Tax=Formosa sp. S-31 TaxID=2790949 RepID=UPI003EBBFA60